LGWSTTAAGQDAVDLLVQLVGVAPGRWLAATAEVRREVLEGKRALLRHADALDQLAVRQEVHLLRLVVIAFGVVQVAGSPTHGTPSTVNSTVRTSPSLPDG
jgi:hypothetical protein